MNNKTQHNIDHASVPTVGHLKELYQWIFTNCPEKPSKFSGYAKIIHRLIKCQPAGNSSQLKPVHLSNFNQINNGHPLAKNTFIQRPSEISRYLLQPASKRIGHEGFRLKMKVKSAGQYSKDPLIVFEFKAYQADFTVTAKSIDENLEDTKWFCETIRILANGDPKDFKPNQLTFDSYIRSKPQHHPDSLDWYNDQVWEIASLFIAITPMDKKNNISHYKKHFKDICIEMQGKDFSDYIKDEYIFGHNAPSEFYLQQAIKTAGRLQKIIQELDTQYKHISAHILIFISQDRLIPQDGKLIIDCSAENLALKTKLYNNTEIQHNSILVTPDIALRLENFYRFEKIASESLLKYNGLVSDLFGTAPFTKDIMLLPPDDHFNKVQRLRTLCEKSTIISLTGGIGIGKTRLLYCLFESFREQPEFRMSYIKCFDYEKNTPHAFAKRFFQYLIQFTRKGGQPEISCDEFITKIHTKSRDHKITKLLTPFDNDISWVITIDNAQWLDSATIKILSKINSIICQNNLPVVLIYSWRYQVFALENHNLQKIHLGTLSERQLSKIAEKINQTYFNNQYSLKQLEETSVKAEGIPLALIERFYPSSLPATYFKRLLCAIDNASNDQQGSYKKIILLAALAGRYFKIDHIITLFSINSDNHFEWEDVHKYISQCLKDMIMLHVVKKMPNQWFCFPQDNIRQVTLKALPGELRNMHLKISEGLYHNHRQDCYEDPLLISNHLLKLNNVGSIPVMNAIKFLHRSAWIEVNRSKFDRAREYFNKISMFVDLIEGEKQKRNSNRIKFYTKLSVDIEMLFLDIVYGRPSKMIQIKLDHLQKRLQKRPKSEYRKDLMDFEIEWIKSYQAYLRGELLKSEEICNKLIKTKEYQQRIHCKQLVHSIRAKIYFKTGRIKESIIESKLLSDVESSDELKSQTILRTSDSSSIAMWLSGYPDQAIETFENNERKHLKLNNIRGLITTYWEGIVLHTIDYNPEQVLFYIETAKKIEEKYSIMSERGFTLLANHLLTLVNIIKGQKTDIHNIDIQMEKLRRHTTLYKPFWKTLLAEAYLKMDQYENCSRCIDDALNISQKTGEIFYLPETHRINAELKLKLDRKKDAKRSYKIALSIAQENNAPMLELRALNSLCVNYDTLNKKEYEKNLRRTSEIMKTFDNKKTTFDIRNAQKILKA